VETHAGSENGNGVALRLPGRNKREKRREWGGGGGCLAFYQLKKEGGRRACGVGAPAGSGALPVEVDGAEWRGAGEEGGSSRVGRDWAVAVGRAEEMVRFLIYSN
jgi:hypothetical protein